MTRNKSQVYSVGNYLMTGKLLGKGNFARVEEATHRIIGKKVAIKIIDLTIIKEDYAQRNLHREPRVMAKLCHPCIAALYETMMHGPRLFLVMEAAGGGDLHDYVHGARGASRGIPESRARLYAAQLVSAVRHMHDRGVVHRDLKMENIMLDISKQLIKIVDFGLSNVWSGCGALRTPCGSLEYAAPEIFVGPRHYGPQVDLWSIGVIVYAMLTGSLPFTAPDTGGGEAHKRTLLCQRISRGYCHKHSGALSRVSNDCKLFVQHLLEPDVTLRMKIQEAARSRWLRVSGLTMKLYPLRLLDHNQHHEIHKEISDLTNQSELEVVAQIKADPFGQTGGIYNIKAHHLQLHTLTATELLWSGLPHEDRPPSPPEYKPKENTVGELNKKSPSPPKVTPPKKVLSKTNESNKAPANKSTNSIEINSKCNSSPVNVTPSSALSRYQASVGADASRRRRLACIHEHSNSSDPKSSSTSRRTPLRRELEGRPLRLGTVSAKIPEKPTESWKRIGDGYSSLRVTGPTVTNKVLLQSNSYRRYSLGSLISPHSSTNSHCKTDRPSIGICSRVVKEESHLHRLRRYTPANIK